MACENITVIQEDSKVGRDFLGLMVEPALEKYKPDMLWIDCALSYLGGDAISQEVVGVFLRVGLNPLLKKYNCGCVIVHHMNKYGSSDSAYAGSGSAEWANMPRAILILSSVAKKGTFELTAAKRGRRLKWTMPDGEAITLKKHLVHSSLEGRIFWTEVDVVENNESQQANKQLDQESEILQRVPQEGDIWQKLLIEKVNRETRIGQNTIKSLITKMIAEKRLFVAEHYRSSGKPKIHYRLTPDTKAELAKQIIQQIQEKKL